MRRWWSRNAGTVLSGIGSKIAPVLYAPSRRPARGEIGSSSIVEPDAELGARHAGSHPGHGCCAVPRKCNITLRHSAADLLLPLSTSSFTLIYPPSQEVLCASAALCNPPTSHSFSHPIFLYIRSPGYPHIINQISNHVRQTLHRCPLRWPCCRLPRPCRRAQRQPHHSSLERGMYSHQQLPFLNITPDTSQIVPAGKPFEITWQPTTTNTVSLVLLKGPAINVIPQYAIVEGIPNTGKFTWTPDTGLEATASNTGYGIQIIDDVNGQYQYSTQFGISSSGKVETSKPAEVKPVDKTSAPAPSAPAATGYNTVPAAPTTIKTSAAPTSSPCTSTTVYVPAGTGAPLPPKNGTAPYPTGALPPKPSAPSTNGTVTPPPFLGAASGLQAGVGFVGAAAALAMLL